MDWKFTLAIVTGMFVVVNFLEGCEAESATARVKNIEDDYDFFPCKFGKIDNLKQIGNCLFLLNEFCFSSRRRRYIGSGKS